jgi:hypothetical protein
LACIAATKFFQQQKVMLHDFVHSKNQISTLMFLSLNPIAKKTQSFCLKEISVIKLLILDNYPWENYSPKKGCYYQNNLI